MKFRYPVYDPVGEHFGLHRWLHWPCNMTQDLDVVMQQPYRVATVPAFFNSDQHWPGVNLLTVAPHLADLRFDQFDLVLVHDVEYRHWGTIQQWMQSVGIDRWLFVSNNHDCQRQLAPTQEFYKPHWMMYTAAVNQHSAVNTIVDKPYVFEAMLGARRPHRDYVMLAMTASALRDRSVVNYRDFPGGFTDIHTQEFQDIFATTELDFPYISSNYDPAWDCVEQVYNHNISFPVPVDLYRHTDYSIVTESTYTGNMIFMSEKTAKVLLSQRVAVWFAPEGFLQHLRGLGFETFGDVIDESYDHDDYHRDWKRFERAWSSCEQLAQSDAVQIYKKLLPRLEHNRHHLETLQQRCVADWQNVMLELIPSQHWSA